MGLLYNRDTSVERDIKQKSQAEYTYLSENNIEQDQQNELSLYNFSPTQEGTYTEIVTDDFTLTQLSCFLQSGTTSTKNHSLYINDELILKWNCAPLAGEEQRIEKEIKFPNVIIRKDSILKLVATESGAQGLSCNYTFIGYYV